MRTTVGCFSMISEKTLGSNHYEVSGIPFAGDLIAPDSCDRIEVYSGSFSVGLDTERTSASGTIYYQFPGPRLLFRGRGNLPRKAFASEALELQVPGYETAEAMVLEHHSSSSERLHEFRGEVKGLLETSPPAGASHSSMGRVRALLVNFPRFIGASVYERQGDAASSRRATFNYAKWSITIDCLPDAKERMAKAQELEGSTVSAFVDIRRCDNKLFDSGQAQQQVTALSWMLSFCAGHRVSLVDARGYRTLEDSVWRSFPRNIVERPSSSLGWFHDHEPSRCLNVCEGLHQLLVDQETREWIELVVALYCSANVNNAGVEAALSLSQVALELLSWSIVVEREQMLSRRGFDSLSAADRIRLALAWAKIPTNLPAIKKTSYSWSSELTGRDGPELLTSLRNAFTHPSKDKRGELKAFDGLGKFWTWQLSQHYVELLILRLAEYDGPYDCRFGRQRPMTVWDILPWSKMAV